MKHPLQQTRNGIPVYVDLIHSLAATHIAYQPHLLGLVQEVITASTAKGPNVNIEYDMGRNIGYNFVVETSDKDTIFYAQPVRDTTFTRFVKNGKPTSTQYVTIQLKLDEDNSYELTDAWIGRLTPPRPGSPEENSESRPYWETHAVVIDSQALQLRTVTKDCPY